MFFFQFNNRNPSYTGVIENSEIEIDKRNGIYDVPQQTGKG